MFEYFKSRGLKEDIIKKFGLKEKENYIMIPYLNKSKKILFYKCRSKYSKKFWYYPKGKELALYNFWNLSSYKDYVVICEGEIDCLTLLQVGINAVGSPGSGLFKQGWVKLFDHINKIYICFDNDMAGIEGARKLAEEYFISRDTYNILVPRDKGAKDINDLAVELEYRKDAFKKLIDQAVRYEATTKEKKEKVKKSVKNKIKVSRFVVGRKIGEIIYSKKDRTGGLLIYDEVTGKIEEADSFEHEGKIYTPDINSELILNSIVKIPKGVSEYRTTEDLISNLHKYLNKYVDIEDEIDRDIVLTYVLLTWVYQRFSSIPYLRVIGDYGTGKSRLLKVLNICYKSIYTSGNASEAPIFRLVHKYGGTLIIDEAELSRRNDRCEGIKEILRFGKDSDGVVARCDGTNFEVKTYKVFGPKILGSRRSYNDDALESRMINIRMRETKYDHIPLNLDVEEFEVDSERIRSKLLLWSFRNYFRIDTNVYINYVDRTVSKRINEMNSPLICIRHWDKDFIEGLLAKAKEKYQSLMEDKSLSIEAEILKEVLRLSEGNSKDPLLKDISENLSELRSKKYSSRFIASIIRDNLGLITSHSRDGTIVVVNKGKLDKLTREYNLKN